MKKIRVIKIGGSCLTSAEDVRKIIQITETIKEDFVLVVSAFKNVTNLIESWYDTGDKLFLEELEELFANIFIELFPEKKFNKDFPLFREIKNIHKDKISRDHAQALGEKLSSRIIESYLSNSGIDIKMSPDDPLIFGDHVNFDFEKSSKKILDFYKTKNHRHVLTQGFASINNDGLLTNLRREGSDLTAVIWAQTLSAQCILYKDVGAIYTDDPKKNKEAKKIEKISFYEYKEKFYFSRVIQDRVIDFCIKHSLPLFIYSCKDNTCGTEIGFS